MEVPVIYSPEAIDRLDKLEAFIAAASYPETAIRYINRILSFVIRSEMHRTQDKAMRNFRPGAGSIGFEHRITISFEVAPHQVTILGLYHGGKQPPFQVRRF